jgi:hypothetical protein
MTQFRLQIWVILFLLVDLSLEAQNDYSLYIRAVDRDSAFVTSSLGLKTIFNNRSQLR